MGINDNSCAIAAVMSTTRINNCENFRIDNF